MTSFLSPAAPASGLPASALSFSDPSAFDPLPSSLHEQVKDLEADVQRLRQDLAAAEEALKDKEASGRAAADPSRQKLERIVGIIEGLISAHVIDQPSDEGSDYEDEDAPHPYVGKPNARAHQSSSDSTDSLQDAGFSPKFQSPVGFNDFAWDAKSAMDRS
jgi:hypothetical protein